jgi:hypothetical protein
MSFNIPGRNSHIHVSQFAFVGVVLFSAFVFAAAVVISATDVDNDEYQLFVAASLPAFPCSRAFSGDVRSELLWAQLSSCSYCHSERLVRKE